MIRGHSRTGREQKRPEPRNYTNKHEKMLSSFVLRVNFVVLVLNLAGIIFNKPMPYSGNPLLIIGKNMFTHVPFKV